MTQQDVASLACCYIEIQNKRVFSVFFAEVYAYVIWYKENSLLANKDKFQTLVLNAIRKEATSIIITLDDTAPNSWASLLMIN